MQTSQKRDISFFNVLDKEWVRSLDCVRRSYGEINYILAYLRQYSDGKEYLIVQYSYDTSTGTFFKVAGFNNSITIEQLAISLSEFDELHKLYDRFFVQFDPITYESFRTDELSMVQAAWQSIFNFFISPLGYILNSIPNVNVLISIGPVDEKQYIFDLATIFDLQFRFYPIERNIETYVLFVAGTSMHTFVENLCGLFKATTTKTIILYGFDKHYSEEDVGACWGNIRELALARGKLYDLTIANAVSAGATIVHLENHDDLLQFFKRGWEGHLLQILTHYESTGEVKRLFFKKRSIRFDLLERLVDQLRASDELRDDIIIDAITCTNFFDFRSLYSRGFKYINLSHHNIDTDNAAFVLNELYSGINARQINWNPVYLDGRHHLHEARSDIQRCFFTIARKGKAILTP